MNMNNQYTILFAYRDRDVLRIKNCMHSLRNQSDERFEVVFVDYGSKEENAGKLRDILVDFSFARYYYVGHPGLLWNKSKAFNYGIKKSSTDYVITADIDLIFHPEFIEKISNVTFKDSFTVFSYAYLPKSQTVKDLEGKEFSELKPTHIGNITGSGIYPKKALEEIHGFDEFYHFYGSEDEDLFTRLENLGLNKRQESENLLLHQWHPRYPSEEKDTLSCMPKLSNIRRINMAHHFMTKKLKLLIPPNQLTWANCHFPEDILKLQKPEKAFELDAKKAFIINFLYNYLPNLNGIIEIKFNLREEGFKLKKVLKTFIGKKTEPIFSPKELNNEVLKLILFNYREYNYEYKIDENFEFILFRIDLTSK